MERQNQVWPPFLDLLDSEPKKAAAEFYTFVAGIIRSSQIKLLKSFNQDELNDAIQEIAIHCIENNFRVLRSYKNEGRPFAAWFYFIARNKIIDMIRKTGREFPVDSEYSISKFHQGPDNSESPGTSTSSPELTLAIETVWKKLDKLDGKCRLLLKLASREFRPREIVKLLKLPEEQAKNVSNDVGYCREKLIRLLSESGFNIENYL